MDTDVLKDALLLSSPIILFQECDMLDIGVGTVESSGCVMEVENARGIPRVKGRDYGSD